MLCPKRPLCHNSSKENLFQRSGTSYLMCMFCNLVLHWAFDLDFPFGLSLAALTESDGLQQMFSSWPFAFYPWPFSQLPAIPLRVIAHLKQSRARWFFLQQRRSEVSLSDHSPFFFSHCPMQILDASYFYFDEIFFFFKLCQYLSASSASTLLVLTEK